MARLGSVASEFGVDRFVGDVAFGVDGPLEKVSDSADAVVYERHLEDDIVLGAEHVADSRHPLSE